MITPEKIYEISDYIGRTLFVSSFEIAYLAVDGDMENGLMNDKVKFFTKMFLKKRENESLPHLPWVVKYGEERFRYGCPMRPSVNHLAGAYNRVTKLKIKASIKVLVRFLSGAGYLAFGVGDEIFAVKGEKGDNELKIKVFGSIGDMERNLYTALRNYDILTIASGDLLHPFIDFYRKYHADIKETDRYIWNIDLWSGEVNPFIGIPYTDMKEFIPNFGRSRLASVIDQLWSHHEFRSISLGSEGVSIKIGKIEFY